MNNDDTKITKHTEIYRGFEITVSREESLVGYELLYYSIFRVSDGFECVSNFTSDDSPLDVFTGYLRDVIDVELKESDPWGEKANEI